MYKKRDFSITLLLAFAFGTFITVLVWWPSW